jgi:hypothetical protein
MRRSNFTGWAMAAALAVAALSAFSQQHEEGPILLPKPKPVAKPAGPTLLVICDLACNWKLDGKARGRIAAGDSATANVVTGQHLVIASIEDGVDQVKQLIKAEEKGQTVVSIELKPVRDARLKTEQEARDKAAQEARDKAAQEARDKAAQEKVARDKAAQAKAEQEARDKAAREKQEKEQKERVQAAQTEAAGLIWTDPATQMIWTKNDNGRNVNWQQAIDYCQNLQLSGLGGWRLPTIDELQDIYDQNVKVGRYHVKGNLQLSGLAEWSSLPGNASGQAWIFYFANGKRYSAVLGFSIGIRALCVRRSGE